MAVTVAAVGAVATSAGATSILVPRPAGVQMGDLLIAHVGMIGATVTGETGWAVATSTTSNRVWYKIATVDDVTAAGWTWTSTANGTIRAVAVVLRGHDPISPIGAQSGQAATAPAVATAASLTATVDGSLVLVAYGSVGGVTPGAFDPAATTISQGNRGSTSAASGRYMRLAGQALNAGQETGPRTIGNPQADYSVRQVVVSAEAAAPVAGYGVRLADGRVAPVRLADGREVPVRLADGRRL